MSKSIASIVDSYQNLAQGFFNAAGRDPDSIVYTQAVLKDEPNSEDLCRSWNSKCYREVSHSILAVAEYLLALGTPLGERIAILSNTRPEWIEADLAILSVGGVSVSVYQSLTPSDIGYILYDSGSEIVFAENQEQVDKLLSLREHPFDIPATEERPSQSVSIRLKKIISFERTAAHPLVISWDDIKRETEGRTISIPDSVSQVQRENLASLVYTSGTTGAPKGVMQTHGNHLANIRQAANAEIYADNTKLFLMLPLAHSFAKLMGYIGFLTTVKLIFPSISDRRTSKANPSALMAVLQDSEAELVPVVPRMLEKMQSGVQNAAKKDGLASRLVGATIDAACKVTHSRMCGGASCLKSLVIYYLTGFVRRKIRARLFGRNFVYGVSGGAKLPIEVAKFFSAIGAEILEGYGLTETCVATNVNRRGKAVLGTVGPVLDSDIQLRIAADGEILFRGPNITRGYWNRPTATAQSWDTEGWFHTGDLGAIDDSGNLSIEGRKKELIVTSGGKKIPPDPIEQKLKASGLISQAVLVGEGQKYCAVLVTLDAHAIEIWARKHNVELTMPLHQASRVKQLIEDEVERVNSTLASFETMKRVAILPEEFTIENGLLTPSMKVKRKEVAKRYAAEIAGLFT